MIITMAHKKYCMNCKFYYDDEIPDTVGCGECRYGPPTALPIFGKYEAYHNRAFPLVSEFDWCWRYIVKDLDVDHISKNIVYYQRW